MRTFPRFFVFPALCGIVLETVAAVPAQSDRGPWVEAAAAKAPMNEAETKAFMRRLTDYVVQNHLKRDEQSPQRGMIYEYFRPAKKGQLGQWIQGEALDTMHDGAWFAVAMANAWRATADGTYHDVLVQSQLPFYLKMLNRGDKLFSSERNDARADVRNLWQNSKEWLLQGREKGFVPYWWDDGASLSLEMLNKKSSELNFPGTSLIPPAENNDARLKGWSHGSSNHMAQDLAVMLQQSWLALRAEDTDTARALGIEVAKAARHLQECRERHGSRNIPACIAAVGVTNQDDAARKRLAVDDWKALPRISNHFVRAVVNPPPGRTMASPGFADDQQYHYYSQLAASGALTEAAAWRVIFNALTEPQLYRLYCDDSPAPPGLSRFDLHPFNFVDGAPVDRRSDRKGPAKGPRPAGSRFGPQNMVCCGWAIQLLRAHPGLWERGLAESGLAEKLGVLDKANPDLPAGWWKTSQAVEQWIRRELGGGLRTWEAIFDHYGYIPTAVGGGSCGAGFPWQELSDSGGYAHLISAASQWLHVLGGRKEWEVYGDATR